MTSARSRDPRIPAAVVRALIASGAADPLLPDHFPVPVVIDDRWWLLPDTPGTGAAGDMAAGDMFVEASPEMAARLAADAARVRAAAAAVRGRGEE